VLDTVFEVVFSGPASIVYNEHGRRIEDDDLDSHPDDASADSDSRAESSSGRSSSTKKSGPALPTFSHIPDVIREPEQPQAAPKSPTKSVNQSPKNSREGLPTIENAEADPSVEHRGRAIEKGKGKEKQQPSNVASRARTRSSAKLAETLTSVWGAITSPISLSRSLREEHSRSPTVSKREGLTLVADPVATADVPLADITNAPETDKTIKKTPIPPETEPKLAVTGLPPAVTEQRPEDIPLPATPSPAAPEPEISTQLSASNATASPRVAPSRKSLSPRAALSPKSTSPRPASVVSSQRQSLSLNPHVDDLNLAASIQLPPSTVTSPKSVGGIKLDDALVNETRPQNENADGVRGDTAETTAGAAVSTTWPGFGEGWPLIGWKAAS